MADDPKGATSIQYRIKADTGTESLRLDWHPAKLPVIAVPRIEPERSADNPVRCIGCGESKCRDAFSPNRNKRNGLKSRCKACLADEQRERRAARREHPEYLVEDRDRRRRYRRVLSEEQFREQMEAQGKRCGGCGWLMRPRQVTEDHALPRSKGGTDDPSNISLLCNACNVQKGDRPMRELRLRLELEGEICPEVADSLYEPEGGWPDW